MRWDALFADLEAQAGALEAAERAAEVEERARGEIGRLSVYDRLRAGIGTPLRIRLLGGATIGGPLMRVGPDWLLMQEAGGREAVAALAQIAGMRGLGRYAAAPGAAGVVESRLSLRHVLRAIARDRSTVRLELADGQSLDGTIDRVGADFCELAAHPPGEARRRSDVRGIELIALPALAAVRRSL